MLSATSPIDSRGSGHRDRLCVTGESTRSDRVGALAMESRRSIVAAGQHRGVPDEGPADGCVCGRGARVQPRSQ
jgi:hypothetical protein